ncbi:hypothetical protein CBR_g8368 [Chara braunii]|uniref:Ribosomal protein S21 n=1 Tax=Chara braunii TaxID=69332 RepID=A0A388KLZ3_CHABU|nr:hypothetical protein CBR_g8368 [Chara braunii]|eukprot:GBG71069.1 hypothetical protein CBR_g8368 [Chara braunii]
MAAQALAALRLPALAAGLTPQRVSSSSSSSSSPNTPEPSLPSSSSSSSSSSPLFSSSSPAAIAGKLLSRGTTPSFAFRSSSNEGDPSTASMEAFQVALNPTLPYADMLNFRGTFNAQIVVGENESVESVVRRFRRAVMQAGVIAECRRRRFHETPQDVRKRKEQSSRRRRTRGKGKRPGGGRPGVGMGDSAEKVQEAGWGFEITDEGERWETDEL